MSHQPECIFKEYLTNCSGGSDLQDITEKRLSSFMWHVWNSFAVTFPTMICYCEKKKNVFMLGFVFVVTFYITKVL